MKKTLITTLCLSAALSLWAQELRIQSFGNTGRLVFNEIDGATSYRVKQAVAPGGPWTVFTGEAAVLNSISPTGSGMITCTVPMTASACFYRIEAERETPIPDDMVLIPGGTNSGQDPDFGNYSLTVNSFYMDKNLVTKEKWDEVYNWAINKGYDFDNTGSQKAANHPVHTVNWYDCVKWCNARSEKEGRPAVYRVNDAVYQAGRANNVTQADVAGYRLPTDVEREYAARGGLQSKRFPWGDTIQHSRANYISHGIESYDTSTTRSYHPTYATGGFPYTSPAGAFAPNDYGLYDMAGNLWEWCYDWNPGQVGSDRVLRGSSWSSNAASCRVGHRGNDWPNYAFYTVGFRTVLSKNE